MRHADWNAWYVATDEAIMMTRLLRSVPSADAWTEAARIIKALVLYGDNELMYTDKTLTLADDYDLVLRHVGERHYYGVR